MPIENLNNRPELLLRIAEGDEQAFRQLVSMYSNKVFFHTLTFVKSWEQAEELSQDIFLHIWQKRDKLPAVEDLDNYLFMISKNYLLSFIRKKVRQFNPAELNDVSDMVQNSAAQYENKELGVLIEKAINHLPEQKRDVFRLIHQEGLSQEQVSQKLGIATRTVRWNLVSATNSIRDFLHRYSVGDLYLLFIFLSNFF